MEKHLYICEYCSKQYLPRRRHKQRFCSNSCRVNSHQRNKNRRPLEDNSPSITANNSNKNKISLAGVGNATIANVVTDLGKAIFIKEENKPSTKGDIKKVLDRLDQVLTPKFSSKVYNSNIREIKNSDQNDDSNPPPLGWV